MANNRVMGGGGTVVNSDFPPSPTARAAQSSAQPSATALRADPALWWLARLERHLDERQPQLAHLESYYQGHHRLAFATPRFRQAFGNLFSAFSDNWMDLVVDASVERLAVEGFRFGVEQEGDKRAWDIWQRNSLDADSKLAHREAVKSGMAYLLVEPDDRGPRITVESPTQVTIAHAPGSRRERLAALKRWRELDGSLTAVVYLPDATHWFHRSDKTSWARPDRSVFPNRAGVVPVVALRNNPSLLVDGQSDIEKVIPLQDAANKLVSDMLVASEYAAFRQRWATGIEIPTDANTGEPETNRFLPAAGRVWTVPSSDVTFGEFSASDLGNYVKAVEMIIQHIAAQTRTPPHYLLGQSGNFPSGESLKSTETGLVAKVRDKQTSFGEAYEEAIRIAFAFDGDDERAQEVSAETMWREPESRTEGELVDALVKMRQLNVPYEELWARWGASPQDVERWKSLTGLPDRPGQASPQEGE